DASSTAPQGALAKETRQRLAAIPVRFVPQPTLCRGIAWQKDFEQVPRREEASVTEAMADRQPAVEPRAPVLLAMNDEVQVAMEIPAGYRQGNEAAPGKRLLEGDSRQAA